MTDNTNKILNQSFSEVTQYKEPEGSATKVKPMQLNPGEQVMFDGQKAQLISIDGDTYTILTHDGLTVDTTKGTIKPVVVKYDEVEAPMKFNMNTLQQIDESFVPCRAVSRGISYTGDKQAFVRFGEWCGKRDSQKVKVITEDYATYTIPKEDITLDEVPEGGRYVDGTTLSIAGEPVRKVKIDAIAYTESTEEHDLIPILLLAPDGYRPATMEKCRLSALAV